jgi:hypothetical protein
MIDLLPNEIVDLIGQWLDDGDLKVATMVCELFRDIFFPKYLRRNEFSPRQSFISLKGLSNFRVFDLIIAFHIDRGPTSPLFSAGMRMQIQNYRA